MGGRGRFDCTAMCEKGHSLNKLFFPKGGIMMEQIILYLGQKKVK